jgi:predicted nucleic acid-binding protein
VIICDTTPLINFAEIGQLDLLDRLFGEVVIHPAVVDELRGKQDIFPRAAAVAEAERFPVREPCDRHLTEALTRNLHPGESECLALAIENPGSLVLLDDLAARSVAESRGLPFAGTLGCIMNAKSRGWIEAVAPLLDDLRRSARFWISKGLEGAILRDAGEV